MLRDLNDELEADGIELAFAELKDPVRDRLRRYGIHDAIGRHRFFPTIGVAVAAYLDETGVDWLDWEDRQDRRSPASRPHGYEAPDGQLRSRRPRRRRHLFRPRNHEVAGEDGSPHTHGPRETIGGGR